MRCAMEAEGMTRRDAMAVAGVTGLAALSGEAVAAGSAQPKGSKTRMARILVSKKGSDHPVRVLPQGKLTPEDVRRIDDVLVNKVIKGLTTCPCMSGII